MKHFQLFELVDKKTYEAEGQDAWLHFDTKALITLDDLREFFGVPITVNNWRSGGQFSFRGYRPPSYPAHLSPMGSAHRIGKAFDCDVHGIAAEMARNLIIACQDEPLLAKIMRLEGGVNWLHFDVVDTGKPRIYVFHA